MSFVLISFLAVAANNHFNDTDINGILEDSFNDNGEICRGFCLKPKRFNIEDVGGNHTVINSGMDNYRICYGFCFGSDVDKTDFSRRILPGAFFFDQKNNIWVLCHGICFE